MKRTDKQRLDWLDVDEGCSVSPVTGLGWGHLPEDGSPKTYPTLRQAIDAAMDAEEGKR